ncbi:MAG: FeoC-like transcriptional regulator [Anaerolineales bacterium]|nr:FeoC-like transcriptional regulator [Anaerolineales bacterium]MCX7754787.1 FeoC-like transcriptional regulator [Anaerolineales bacterium]MDW8279082.1 FeoC-like transcriptional regulator [Anaerolineales bacterium]
MLEQLLSEIRSGGTLEVNALSKKLGVSPQLVVVMLDHLQQAGYLQPYAAACGEACGGCSLRRECSHAGRVDLLKLWQG